LGERRHRALTTINSEGTAMKKIVLLAAVLGFAAAISAPAADAQANWDKYCAMCHGKDGKGQTMIGKKLDIRDFTDAKFQASFTDADATKTIKEGKKDKDGKLLMKPFGNGNKLSDDEIKALVVYVRNFKK
jgi:cytochrome c5